MIETRPYDVQNYLATPEDRPAYLEAALEDGDTEVIATALGEIARAIGVGELARQSGVSRQTIYKGFAPGGNPTLATITKVAKVLTLLVRQYFRKLSWPGTAMVANPFHYLGDAQ
jgi:probable addiction module antidote protein